MVRLVRGKLDRLARMTLGALTVIDVHAREVTKRLVKANMTSVNDFEWISQMRCVRRLCNVLVRVLARAALTERRGGGGAATTGAASRTSPAT
jgi:dynein heavy chain